MNLLPLLAQAASTPHITPGDWLFNAVGSTYGAAADFIVAMINWVNVVCVVGIVATMVYFIIRYRQTDRNYVPKGPTHNTALELTWSIGPSIFLAIIFILGFKGFMHMSETPSDAKVTVKVIAQKWSWKFQYENGYVNDTEVILPGNTPVRFLITSKDVIHSFSSPQWRMKKDAVPGRQNEMWVNAIYDPSDKNSTFERTIADPSERDANGDPVIRKFTVNVMDIFCQEYCGKDHSRMLGRAVIVDPKDFAKFMELTNNIRRDSPILVGEKIYKANCASCHSVDGGASTGPTWLKIWGRSEHIVGLSEPITIDHAYVKESIMLPAAKIVEGFQGKNMPAFTLTDDQIDAVVEYMKTLEPSVETKPLDWKGIDQARDAAKKAEAPAAQ